MKQTIMLFSIFLLLIPLASIAQVDKTDVTGTWKLNVGLDGNSSTVTFTFKQKEENLTGTYQGALGKADITGTIKGDQIEFSFKVQEETKIIYKGTIDGYEMKGTCDYGGFASGTFTGKREGQKEA